MRNSKEDGTREGRRDTLLAEGRGTKRGPHLDFVQKGPNSDCSERGRFTDFIKKRGQYTSSPLKRSASEEFQPLDDSAVAREILCDQRTGLGTSLVARHDYN